MVDHPTTQLPDCTTTQHGIDPATLRAPANAALIQSNRASREHYAFPQPLRIETGPVPDVRCDDSLATSPRLSKHVIYAPENNAQILPAMQSTSSSQHGSATSPTLPSLRQVTGQIRIGDPLTDLAEAALRQDAQYHSGRQHYSQATEPGSARSQFAARHDYVRLPSQEHHNYHANPAFSAPADAQYGSPLQHSSTAYFNSRRVSMSRDRVPQLPPSLTSASSSGDSFGPATSSIDGHTPSTAQTTPTIDATPTAESTPRSSFPPHYLQPTVSHAFAIGYPCEYPGCTAPPFHTQYLLSSHRNVHSQARNHFCDVPGCPRSESGQGFKRKNEMKRHALVHRSPGYVCPFCSGAVIHKYPRPDNLLRHVRAHHKDKNRDDPLLCDILAQRVNGTDKVAQRRGNSVSAI